MKLSRGRLLLKALKTAKLPSTPPSAKQVEHERSMWGPNPLGDEFTAAEDLLFKTGQTFLMALYGAVLGTSTKGKEFKKAFGDNPLPPPAGWGDIAKLFLAGGDPQKQVTAWEGIVDKLLGTLLKTETEQQVAQAWAVRTFMLGKIGTGAGAGGWPTFENLLPTLEEREAQVLGWTAARGAVHMAGLKDSAKKAIREELSAGAQENLRYGALQQRLFDRFSGMNRDWRRVVVTETAFAVQNGTLASVDPKEDWEVQWVTAANACPFCQAMDGKRFKLVAPIKSKKDGQTEVWVGKTNIGRHSSKRDKDGNLRGPDELWWPCIPAHPHCSCRWVLRRPKVQVPKVQTSEGAMQA